MSYYAICERVGCVSPRLLLAQLDARELAEWQIFLNLDYWRDKVDMADSPEARTAQLKALLTGSAQHGNPNL